MACAKSTMQSLAACYIAACLVVVQCQAKKPQNILFINVDDLRRVDDPNIHAPHMKTLLQDGIFFSNAYAQAPHCCPTRNSYMTGRRPDSTRVYNGGGRYNFRQVGPSWVTLPQFFKQQGYISVGVGKVFHEYGNKGPDYWGYHKHGNRTDEPSWSAEGLPYLDPLPSRCPKTYNGTRQPSGCIVKKNKDDKIAETAVSWIRNLAGGKKPFFIACGFHRPHLPWAVPQQYYDHYSLDSIPLAKWKIAPDGHVPIGWRRPFGPLHSEEHSDQDLGAWNSTPSQPLADTEAAHLRRGYYAAVSYIDERIGQLISALQQSGVYNSTIVALHGDHGWQLGEQGEWSKMTLYDLSLRTGLFLRDPEASQNHGRRDNGVAELLDLYPTLQELAGFTVSPELQGQSLAGRVRGDKASAKGAMALSSYPRCLDDPAVPWRNNECWFAERSNFSAMGYTLRNQTWRFTWWLRWNGTHETPEWNGEDFGAELFDHTGDDATDLDKFGNVNVALAHPHVVSEMKSTIKSIVERALQMTSAVTLL